MRRCAGLVDEKLQSLSQEQLLNLLENLDHQRLSAGFTEGAAARFDQRSLFAV